MSNSPGRQMQFSRFAWSILGGVKTLIAVTFVGVLLIGFLVGVFASAQAGRWGAAVIGGVLCILPAIALVQYVTSLSRYLPW